MEPYKRSVREAYAIVTSGKPAYKPKWPKPNWENRVPHCGLGLSQSGKALSQSEGACAMPKPKCGESLSQSSLEA